MIKNYSSGAGSSNISSSGGASRGGPLSIELFGPKPSNDSNDGGSSSTASRDASILSVDVFEDGSFGCCLLYENPAPLWNLSAWCLSDCCWVNFFPQIVHDILILSSCVLTWLWHVCLVWKPFYGFNIVRTVLNMYRNGDSNVDDIVMLVTLWQWLIWDVGGGIILLATFFVMLVIFQMYLMIRF